MNVNTALRKGHTPPPLSSPRPRKAGGTSGKASGELSGGCWTLWPHLVHNKALGGSVAQRLVQRKGAATGVRGGSTEVLEGEIGSTDPRWRGGKSGTDAGGVGRAKNVGSGHGGDKEGLG